MAQEDAENCKDHPFFTRLSNFSIETCSENFNMMDFVTGVNKTENKEGNLTKIQYVFNSETAKMPSELQIIRNYEAAILKNGGKKFLLGVRMERQTIFLTVRLPWLKTVSNIG
jgi:hypothetical protein